MATKKDKADEAGGTAVAEMPPQGEGQRVIEPGPERLEAYRDPDGNLHIIIPRDHAELKPAATAMASYFSTYANSGDAQTIHRAVREGDQTVA